MQLRSSFQEEDFDEDEGLYDDLHLDEVEDTFGIGGEDRDSESESGSDNEGQMTPSAPLVL